MWHWAFVLVRWCSLFVATVATGESRTGESDARTGATCGAWFEFDLNWMSRSGGGNLDGDVGDGVEFCGRGDVETAVPRSTGDSSIPVPAILKRCLASSAQHERTRTFYTPNLTSIALPPGTYPDMPCRRALPPRCLWSHRAKGGGLTVGAGRVGGRRNEPFCATPDSSSMVAWWSDPTKERLRKQFRKLFFCFRCRQTARRCYSFAVLL